MFHRNFVPEMHRFRNIWLQICRDLESLVRGPSRSLEISPFDRAHMTSYWRSIVIMALSRVILEIFNVERCCDLEIWVMGHSRSLKVVPFDRLGIDGAILHHFQDRRCFLSKIAKLSNPPCIFRSHWRCCPWNWVSARGVKKLEWWCYEMVK